MNLNPYQSRYLEDPCEHNLIFTYSYHYTFQDDNPGDFNSSENDEDIDLPGKSCPVCVYQFKVNVHF